MYERFGVMLDVSRNAVMTVEQVKKFIDVLVKMGYNTLELYAEDTYKLDEEPLFGYMRGGYSCAELKEIDNYAIAQGVELTPCVQTLAHFTNLIKIPKYNAITDIADILLVDEPKTYELIDKIFKNLSICFTSRNVNIGMDEAHLVGLGKYLDLNGYKNRYDILIRHLNKVIEIANKYGFTCHMWSDMFFRLSQKGKYYDVNAKINDDVIKIIPENVELVYWDYYNKDSEIYQSMFNAHLRTQRKVWFAGGAWCWNGFAPFNNLSMLTMKTAMQNVLKNNISNVLITMWGDNGKECSFYSLLPSLYAIRQYANGIFDEQSIKEGFKQTVGYDFDTFMLLDLPNSVINKKDNFDNACKSILYSDCFVGRIEKDLEFYDDVDFQDVSNKLKDALGYAGEYRYIFQCLADLCSVLDIKKNLGVKTRKAYQSKDIKQLRSLIKKYQLCCLRLKEFYNSFKKLWLIENKPFGWEIQDARLGGVMQRLISCNERIEDFINGKIDAIDELEENVLLLGETPSLQCNNYRLLISPSEM